MSKQFGMYSDGLLVLVISFSLLACDSGSSRKGIPDGVLAVDCSGPNCSSYDDYTYARGGIGAWAFRNTSLVPVKVPVEIKRTDGMTVTLVFTNQSNQEQIMPAITLSDDQINPLQKKMQVRNQLRLDSQRSSQRLSSHEIFRKLTSRQDKLARPQEKRINQVNDVRSWNVFADDGSTLSRTAKLISQVTAFDGRKINFWVEETEYDPTKISQDVIDYFVDKFANGPRAIYKSLTFLSGQPWGTHNYPTLIEASQDMDIVIVQFNKPGQPEINFAGYFYSLNNFLKSVEPDSNESVSFYLDSEYIYRNKNPDGTVTEASLASAANSLGHEMNHMVNFYQRTALKSPAVDYSFPSWMEELTSLMVEDLLSGDISTQYSSINGRYYSWLGYAAYNCNVTDFSIDINDLCYGYDISGSFAAYLNRQLGMHFYQQMVQDFSSTEGFEILDHSIKFANGPGVEESIRKFAASIAMIPYDIAPSGLGYPWVYNSGYVLSGMDGIYYESIRNLPNAVPEKLVAFGSFPVERKNVVGDFKEVVTVPPKSALSVIVRPTY